MDEARPGKSPLGPVAGVLLGTALLGLGGCLVFGGVAVMDELLGRTIFLAAGICFLLLGILAVGIGIFRSRWKDSAAQKPPLQQRAEHSGQPTEPEAYQDGGLAVAATAENLPDAEIIASALKSEGIPAWTHAPAAASLGIWAYRPADGVRVLVPHGRLHDAQAVLERHKARQEIVEEPTDSHSDDAEDLRFVRQAMALSAAAILVAPVAPYLLYRAFKLSAAIAGARRQWWTSPTLRKAHRWTLVAFFFATVSSVACWGLIFPAMIVSCAR